MMPTAWQDKTGEHKKTNDCPNPGVRGQDEQAEHRATWGSGTVLYETWHHMWSKLTELCNTSEAVWAMDLVKKNSSILVQQL